MNEKEKLLEILSKEDYQVLALAYIYAKNMYIYGEDVTNTIQSATQNAAMLEKAYKKGYYDAIEKCKPECPFIQWIPCREKQPDKTGQYLVTIKYRHDEKGYIYMTTRRNYYADYQTWEDSLVIAWQPLPEPYTEGSRKE